MGCWDYVKWANPYYGASELGAKAAGKAVGIDGDFFQGKTPVIPAFGPQDQAFADMTKNAIGGLRTGLDTSPNAQQNQAAQLLSQFNPQSFMGGVSGYLGQGANALGQAQRAAMGPGFGGSSNLLGQTIGGNFLDVSGGPYAARNAAIGQQMQSFLNQNLDTIGGAAQAASGGIGAGSAGVESKRRAINQSGQDYGNTIAQLSAQDLAAERANQMQAMGMGLQLPFQQASALSGIGQGYQGLGSIFGQAGTAAGQLGLGQANALGNLGQQFWQQGMAGQTLPLDYMLSYLSAARQVPGQQGASPFAQLMQGFAQLGQGAGAMAGA